MYNLGNDVVREDNINRVFSVDINGVSVAKQLNIAEEYGSERAVIKKYIVLDLQDLSQLDFSKEWRAGAPAFYRYDFQLDHTLDTYLDMTGFGKGVVFVNGHNLGRFWEVGPTTSLYVPHGFLKEGANSLIVFETEGRYQETLQLVQQPTFKEVKGENL